MRGAARAGAPRESPAARDESGIVLVRTAVSPELAAGGESRLHDMLRAELEQDPALRPLLDGVLPGREGGRWVAAMAFLSGARGTEGRSLVLEVRASAGGRERRVRAEGSLFAQVAVVKDAARRVRAALATLDAEADRPASR